jgi:hypothetical protein
MEVKIHIKDPILRAYLNGLFVVREDGAYTLNTDSLTGTVICSLVQPSDYPTAEEHGGKETVTFRLPRSRSFERFRGRAVWLPPHAEAVVNKVLRREFDLNLDASCTEARMAGVRLMDAIEAFIVSNGMDGHFSGGIETLKKRFYRSELNTLKRMREIMRQQANMRLRRRRKKMDLVGGV